MTSSNWNNSEVSPQESETDGRNLQRACEPPTNESVYILPGNTAEEAYRLSTYSRFPHEVPVSASDLAAAGFFYTGYKDRVKCFKCAASVERWPVGNNPHDSKWHKPDCSLNKGEECGNIRIGAGGQFGRRFNQTSTSSVRVRSGPSQPPELATIPSVHHEQLGRSLDLRRESKLLCEFVIQGRGPEFVDEIVRLFPNLRRPNLRNGVDVPPSGRSGATFSPMVVIDPQPRQQGAVVNDIEYQSPEFVQETVRLFPSLRSSIFRNRVDVPPFEPFGALSSSVVVIDPQVEMQRNKERAAKKMNSSFVKMAEEMGFARSAIQKSIERKLTKDNTMYQTFREIIDDLLNMSGDSDEDTEQSSMDVDSQSQPENTPQSAAAGVPSSMEERMKELEDERKCKICLDALADVVFVPCGHLCSCVRCAQSLRECPICRGKIEKAIKTYLS